MSKVLTLLAMVILAYFTTKARAGTHHLASLNVLTLNTWLIPVIRKKAYPRSEIIAQEIERYDLVGLQEVFKKRAKKRLTRFFTKERPYHTTRGDLLHTGSGLFNYSKYQLKNQKFFPFQKCGGVQCLSKKGVLYSLVDLGSIKVNFLNTHLQAFASSADIRKEQFLTIKKALTHTDPKYPTIFLGDFNINAESKEYPSLLNVLTGFEDVWKVAHGDSNPGYTWDVENNTWISRLMTSTSERIDYIFIKGTSDISIEVSEAKIVFDEKLPYTVRRGGEMLASDHFGVMATLEFIQ